MTTATKPPRKPARLKSVTAMVDSIDYGDEMKTLERIWDELVRDVRASAYVLPPVRRSTLDEHLEFVADGFDFADTPLFDATLRGFEEKR